MAISDKTRKILWGRCGNRCALCKQLIVLNATSADSEAIVGDECHIVSPKKLGPRHDPALPESQMDEPDNLILLCRVHHKLVDDQPGTYTVERLKSMRRDHEAWVDATLSEEEKKPNPIRIRRIKENAPTHLARITSGQQFLSIVGGASAGMFTNDDPKHEGEMQLISSFLQEAQDWGELADGFEAGQRVEAEFRMSAMIREIEKEGFWVFGAREIQRLEGGVGIPSNWTVAHVRLVRSNNPEIMFVDKPNGAGGA